jgi:acetyltransferase
MGEEQVREGARAAGNAGIPAFRMPETAIELYYHISTYYWNQKLLLQTPAPLSKHFARKPKAPRC